MDMTKPARILSLLIFDDFSVELLFILFVRYIQKLRSQQLAAAAKLTAPTNMTSPVTVK